MNVLQTGSYTKTDTRPSARPADKGKTQQEAPSVVPAKVLQSVDEHEAIGTMLGITVWRMRPAEEADEVKLRQANELITPVRVRSDTPLRNGDRLRLTIETPRKGYLYVIDREQYADGSMSAPTLIFPQRDLLSGDNAVNERVGVEIPGIADNPPFLILTRKRPDHEAEVITVLVSDEPLPGIGIGRNASSDELPLREEQVNAWTSKWSGRAERFDLDAGENVPMRGAEAEVANRKRALVHGDPSPKQFIGSQMRIQILR